MLVKRVIDGNVVFEYPETKKCKYIYLNNRQDIKKINRYNHWVSKFDDLRFFETDHNNLWTLQYSKYDEHVNVTFPTNYILTPDKDFGGLSFKAVPIDGSPHPIYDSLQQKIITEIDRVVESKEKLGVLLYGPPGTGKTTFIRNILTIYPDAVKINYNDATPKVNWNDDQLKIFIIEELVTHTSSALVAEMLDFMDGLTKLKNAIFIATTNYPENLPGNIVARPGRFDIVEKIGAPGEATKKALIESILTKAEPAEHGIAQKVSEKELKAITRRILDLGDDFMLADIVLLLNKIKHRENTLNSLTLEIDKLQAHKKLVASDFAENDNTIGIQ